MNAQKTAVMMDSCGDLPIDIRRQYNIYTLPVHVIYPEGDYLDGIDIDPRVVYDRFPEEIPKTSTPSPQEAIDLFERIREDGYENVVCICISSRLSSTVNTIRIASEEVEGLRAFVFDTKNIDIGSGIFAYWTARKLEEGMAFEEICEKLEEKRYDSHLMFFMDTLKYLIAGGRIGRVAGMLGEALKLKPIISCDEEGVYYTVSKIRGKKNGQKKLLDLLAREAEGHECWVVVGHGDADKESEAFLEKVKERIPQAEFLFRHQIVASMAINTGPGLIGLLVLIDP